MANTPEVPEHVDLARLPKELGCSRRHLITQFHKYFGMAPKMIARLSHFNSCESTGKRPCA